MVAQPDIGHSRELVTRQEAVARIQERRNAGRRQRKASEDIDPMDPVSPVPRLCLKFTPEIL